MLFTELALHERLQRAITMAGYTDTTPIQAATIPLGLAGKDIVGTAQTGTGKTAAFVLPILQRLIDTPPTGRTRAVIVTPTRELAEQINDAIKMLGKHTNILSQTVYGGVGMVPQERALRRGVDIIIACPGRLLDHMQRGNCNLSKVEVLVLDEADRMLDMGFLPPIRQILSAMPTERQTMLFSATFAPELNALVREHLNQPHRIEMGFAAPAETVEHSLYPVQEHLKVPLLLGLLEDCDTKSVLIFTRTKHRANRVTEKLERAGHNAVVLHSNKSQAQRQQALDGFKRGKYDVLVATDIAARGIDVASISHVINFDIPDCADTYIHRIGRTGRATHNGEAFTLVTTADYGDIRDIERKLGNRLETRTLAGFDYAQAGPSRSELDDRPERPQGRGGRPSARSSSPYRPQQANRQQAAPRPEGNAPAAAAPRQQYNAAPTAAPAPARAPMPSRNAAPAGGGRPHNDGPRPQTVKPRQGPSRPDPMNFDPNYKPRSRKPGSRPARRP